MTKEAKTKTIEEILKGMEDAKEVARDEIEITVDACLEAICCKEVDWKSFRVYESSVPIMKNMLKAMAVEYFLVIADEVRDLDVEVKIALKKAKKSSVWMVPVNHSEIVAVISISDKCYKNLQKYIMSQIEII